MLVRSLTIDDLDRMARINQEGLPGTGKISDKQLATLLDMCELAIGVEKEGVLVGYVLCLLRGAPYWSLNYAWFNERYKKFIYVDRIAVDTQFRDQGIGSKLYQKVIQYSTKNNVSITAEVSLVPPNPGSDRFHIRHSFNSVGEFHQENQSVTMYIRDYQLNKNGKNK